MDEAMIEIMMQSGSLAGFAAYLVFQTKQLQRRFDELNNNAQAREDMLRGRYDKVISDLQSEKATLQTQTQLHLQDMGKKLDTVVSDVSLLKEAVQELKVKNIVRETQRNGK
tara:strand:+ start:1075 stop:1410 length:336 start_codon:yes stop_codon:yes gene_type:complete